VAVAVADRLVKRVLDSEVELTRDAASRELHRLLATEPPLSSNAVVDSVVDSLVGLGPLEPLLRDPTVSDVLVNFQSRWWCR
jgi:pilus assembly protein CpaF